YCFDRDDINLSQFISDKRTTCDGESSLPPFFARLLPQGSSWQVRWHRGHGPGELEQLATNARPTLMPCSIPRCCFSETTGQHGRVALIVPLGLMQRSPALRRD